MKKGLPRRVQFPGAWRSGTLALTALCYACAGAGIEAPGLSEPVLDGGDAVSADGAPADDGNCDVDEPTLACIRKLYIPLRTAEVPFDAKRVEAAFHEHATAIAPDWVLTAHHVLEAEAQAPYRCFFPEDVYAASAAEPARGPGCSPFLMAGGHPQATQCLEASIRLSRCVDMVPFREAFDIVVKKAAQPSPMHLDLAAERPQVGDEVFIVAMPSFSWLSEKERATLQYPLVSRGRAVAVEGSGVIMTAAASAGSSGGAVLNEKGQVLGVAYTLVGDQRAQGTEVPEAASDRDTVAVLVNERTRELIAGAR